MVHVHFHWKELFTSSDVGPIAASYTVALRQQPLTFKSVFDFVLTSFVSRMYISGAGSQPAAHPPVWDWHASCRPDRWGQDHLRAPLCGRQDPAPGGHLYPGLGGQHPRPPGRHQGHRVLRCSFEVSQASLGI